MAATSNRLTLRIRHPRAFDTQATVRGFGALSGHKYALLTTFRRSGEGVPTPVWFGLDEAGKAYFRTDADIGKVRRIRNDPRVLLGPCSLRGKPLGPMAEGRARPLPPEESERAEAALQAKYGLGRRLYEGAAGATGIGTLYVEIEPVP